MGREHRSLLNEVQLVIILISMGIIITLAAVALLMVSRSMLADLRARDAIAGVGRISIETGNITVDARYGSDHPDAAPGDYVMIGFSDTGCGMDSRTRSQIFEAYFTTKPVGKGTGLGLATVYGIVRQNEGFINVYSEPGKGTTFRIYLPQADEAVTAAPETRMPRMNCRELAERIGRIHPGIRCLFMSGSTAVVIAHHGVLADGVWFIQKPFAVDDLGRKVREVLDG